MFRGEEISISIDREVVKIARCLYFLISIMSYCLKIVHIHGKFRLYIFHLLNVLYMCIKNDTAKIEHLLQRSIDKRNLDFHFFLIAEFQFA